MKPIKASSLKITPDYDPLVLPVSQSLIAECQKVGAIVYPELEARKVYMDGSFKEFLEKLRAQYMLDLVGLVPAGYSDDDILEFKVRDEVLNGQIGIITYLLDNEAHNKMLDKSKKPTEFTL